MHITIPCGEWRLEGVLAERTDTDRAAVICHPHPLYGGNMNNPVVRAIEDGFQRAGLATLRFNFRGVGESTGSYGAGIGEADDLRAAAAWILDYTGAEALSVAGYSFGAMVVLRAGGGIAQADRLVAVAPPLSFFDLGGLNLGAMSKLFIVGDRDQYCDAGELARQLIDVPEPARSVVVAGADHFLFGYEAEIRAIVAESEAKEER